ncbi:CaiB/BaiF CoA-transferase family protein [Paracoccus sp. SCSIO 75233]|uniref:CaiB/BaiF CoA transferase family protein n=1 Tax=Paracoccus sp. SCSIO 75233 TaxID=3017782 RepID=UPI0022F0F836|nr:CaiB/BaiF CoA-transferase family protein [Paracoccus sp. SCSIO 75233]WBU52418.1 CaiB/BaiF CoA-transferase family protein [Paracoccus sp. SCSIO 75233]
MKPLLGITVLDLSRVLAGPLCAQTLGDLGANVIKLETIGSGDESRTWPPFHNGVSAAYLMANRNKRSVAINLKSSDGQKILHRLVESADVVVESAATGVSARLGADYETLRSINEKIIYCTISGFGRTGPLRKARGYDVILQAYSGMMSMTGYAEGGLVRVPYSPIDQTTGHHAVTGILAALLERGRTGKGTYIEVSLLETAVNFLNYNIQSYLVTKELPARPGSAHPGIAPYQAFETADRAVIIGIANDKLWRAFCKSYGVDELAEDPLFLTNRDRVQNRAAAVEVVQSIVRDMASATLLEQLESIGIPSAPVNTLEDLIRSPQLKARGMLQEITGDGACAGAWSVPLPILFDQHERGLGSPPPRLGEHTSPVLREAGFSDEEIRSFEGAGVVAS